MILTLNNISTLKSLDELIGTEVYALIDSGTFGFRVVTGAITGINFTKSEPELHIVSLQYSGWSKGNMVTTDRAELLEMINIPDIGHKHQPAIVSIKFPTRET
jgi:hypothetical protein